MTETITTSCEIIPCDKRELLLLRRLLKSSSRLLAIVDDSDLAAVNLELAQMQHDVEALKPWSTHYGECQL